MKIVVCGDRNWIDEAKIHKFLLNHEKDTIITGGCSGADKITERLCGELKIECKIYNADWEKFGKGAGFIRNNLMLNNNPDLVVAFHSSIEDSKGSKMCLILAERRGIETLVIV